MVWKARETMRGFGSSLLGAMAVSTILTATVALPLGLDAIGDDDRPHGIDDAIAIDDGRFPDPVSLAAEEIEILASDDLVDEPLTDDAEVAGVFVTPTATPTADLVVDIDPGAAEEDDEFAIAFPTPTAVADPPVATTPPAQPTTAPRAPEADEATEPEPPTPEAPGDDTEADPEPTAPPEPTQTTAPQATPEPEPTVDEAPTPDPDGPSTDLYAYVSGSPLREDQEGSLEIKTVNRGATETTGVTVSISAAGASILSVSPGRADWTCTGTDDAWQCNGPTLEAVSSSRGVMTLLPHDEDLTVSVSVDHALVDEDPDNNSFSTAVPVVPNPNSLDELDEVEEPTGTPTAVDPPDPAAEPEPTEPTEPTVTPTTTPTDPDDPGGDGTNGPLPDPTPTPTDTGGDGTNGPLPDPTPTPTDPDDPGSDGTNGPLPDAESAGGASGEEPVGQVTDVVATEQEPAVEPEDVEIVGDAGP